MKLDAGDASRNHLLFESSNERGAYALTLALGRDGHRAQMPRAEVEGHASDDAFTFARNDMETCLFAREPNGVEPHPERRSEHAMTKLSRKLVASIRLQVDEVDFHGPSIAWTAVYERSADMSRNTPRVEKR